MINDASVVIGGGNWGIKEADVLGYKLINNEYYARDIDFANSTADGTYMDSTGYVRRSPYNLFTYSEELDNVLWLKNNITIVPNAGIAPNNTYTADSYASTTTVGPHPCYQSKVVTRNTYTYSVYVQKVNSRYVSLKGAGGMTVWTGVIFDLDTASVVSIQNNNIPGTTGAITSEGNGWYRISMTATSNFNDFGLQYASSPSNTFGNYGDLSIAGSGLVDYLLWGMQVVQGSSPMPYFYTTTRLNVPRIDYSNPDGTLSTTGRLLLEPQRTNSIRNSSMVGAVAGSPGTLPTNWATALSGLTRTIVGIGTENGLPYIDIRLNGTATGTNAQVQFDNLISASASQVWTNSFYLKTVSVTNAPNSYALNITELDSSGNFLTQGTQVFTPTLTLNRYTFTRTLANPSVARLVGIAQFNLTIGQTYDFTIRIAAPQMELGAYATTWIPTTTAAVTRNADLASRTGVSSWIGQTEGTLFAEVNLTTLQGATARTFMDIGSAFNRVFLGFTSVSSNTIRLQIDAGGAGAVVDFRAVVSSTGTIKVAAAYKTGDCALYVNGVAGTLVANGAISFTTISNLFLGQTISNTAPLGDGVAQAALFPTRLTNAQLAQLTTL